MKALQVFFMLLPISLLAQTDSSYGHSRLQLFLMEPGRSIHVSTDTIAVLNSVEVGVITARDWQTGEQRSALSFARVTVQQYIFFSQQYPIGYRRTGTADPDTGYGKQNQFCQKAG